MSDTVTVLLAAFGGGLAGAVLQPVVSYVLQRIRSGEEIRRMRERSLRRMIEAALLDGRARAADLLLREVGIPVAAREREARPLWQPERIPDPSLQRVAREYNEVRVGLFRISSSNAPDYKKAYTLIGELEKLQQQITLRMDELNWPEADD